MLDQTKNMLIGIFVIAAIAITSYILLFLHPSVGDEGQELKVRFSDVDKVSVGTRVLFAGYPVGEIAEIEEVANARDVSQVRGDEVFIYELTLKVDSGVIIYMTDEIASATSGLLGEKSIIITPRPAPKGETLVRVTDQVIYATPQGSVQKALLHLENLAEKLDDQLGTMSEGKFAENLSSSIANINKITGSMAHGDGSFGQLMTKDDFYLRITSLLSKAETVMDAISQYGLLFQNNKVYQRLQARRANLIGKLCTAKEFHNYFTDEINAISTSLSRVSLVLGDKCAWSNVCDDEFSYRFADLLRRIDGLEKSIKLIDEQVVEKREKCK